MKTLVKYFALAVGP